MVYNGEIYNFQDLRRQLEEQGEAFHTTSDTEVLLKAIICYGLDAILPKLEGMFAFGLWDSQERALTLVRDRFGIKPLSIYEDGNCLIFSSEIKGMAPWVPLRPDSHVALAYLSGFGGPTRGQSFFGNVSLLAPGTILESRGGRRSVVRSYFAIADFWCREEQVRLRSMGELTLVDRLDELLSTSVRKHLIADAPVGALCSGGIDSSLVMAMASRSHSNLAIFHADVKGALSEFGAAKALAKHLKLDMLTVQVHDQDFIDQMAFVTHHYEYPFLYHPNSVPFAMVTQLVRDNGVKAILSGEGSDECFLGYGQLALEDVRLQYRRALLWLRDAVRRIPSVGRELWPFAPESHAFVAALLQDFERDLDVADIQQRVMPPGVKVRQREYRSLEWLGYHLRTLLHRNDALGMAASVEARFPYLDNEVVRTAVNLPYRYKIRPSLTTFDRAHPLLCDKWIVRKVADRYIPRALSRRKKLGFPVNAYDRLHVNPSLYRDGFVAELLRLSDRAMCHLLQESDPQFRVRLLLLEVWGLMFFRGIAEGEARARLRSHATIDPVAA